VESGDIGDRLSDPFREGDGSKWHRLSQELSRMDIPQIEIDVTINESWMD